MQTISALEVGHYHTKITAGIHDMPIGNAFSGPAYGEYEKSKGLGMILGVVASVLTMGAALPMLAGSVGMQIAGGAMMAGGVLTGVGAITGNQKLMKVGGILSLAGGLGGMAVNSGLLGSTAGVGVNATGSEALATFAKNASSSVDSVFGTSLAEKAAGYAGSGAVEAVSSASDAGQLQLAGDTGTGNALTMAAPATPAPVGTPLDAVTNGGAGAADTITMAAPSNMAPVGTPLPSVKPGLIERGMQLADKYPTGSKLLTETVGGFIKAGFSGEEQASAEALARKYDAEAVLLGTDEEIKQWKLKNANTQVSMISAGLRPEEQEAMIAKAKAAGHQIAFIPAIGRVTPGPGATPMTNAQQTTTANPVPAFAPIQP